MERTQQNWLLHVTWAVFAGIALTYVAHGGMWLDEMQVWCLARDSSSVSDLFYNMRLEGHPPLWHLLVRGITYASADPRAMSTVHVAFGIGTAYLVLYHSKWPVVWRILSVFGYFVLFEYTAIARNYGPGMFFLFFAAFAYTNERKLFVSVALIALAFTHYWGIVVSGSFALVHLLFYRSSHTDRMYSLAIIGFAAFALYVAIPSASLGYKPSLDHLVTSTLFNDLERIFGQVFVPFPDLDSLRPWDTSWLLNNWPHMHGIIGFACVTATVWILSSDRKWLLFYLIVLMGIATFPLLAPFRSIRYVGPIFLAFLTALWCSRIALERQKRIAALVLLAIQIPAGTTMFLINLNTPRSMADQTAEFIRTSSHSELPIAVHPFQIAPSISGYMDRKVWNLSTASWESFCKWDSGPFRLPPNEIERSLGKVPFAEFLLITDEPDTQKLSTDGSSIVQLAKFTGAMIRSEDHYLYLVQRYDRH